MFTSLYSSASWQLPTVDDDEVFAVVSAELSPELLQNLDNFEDVIDEVEQRVGVEIRYSRRRYIFIGSWKQISLSRELLEKHRYRSDSATSGSFEVNHGVHSVVQQRRRDRYEAGPTSTEETASEQSETEVVRRGEAISKDGPDSVDRAASNADLANDLPNVESNDPDPHSQASNISRQREPQSENVQAEQPEGDTMERNVKEVQSNEAEGQSKAEIMNLKPLIMDGNVLEYMTQTGVMMSIKEEYNVNIVMENDEAYQKIRVRVTAAEGKETNKEDISVARDLLSKSYNTLRNTLSEEVCDLGDCIPVALAEKVWGEASARFPTVLIRKCATGTKYVFTGSDADVTECRRFFTTRANEFSESKSPLRRSRVAAGFGKGGSAQLSKYERQEEARTIQREAATEEPSETTRPLDYVEGSRQTQSEPRTDDFSDMPELEEIDSKCSEDDGRVDSPNYQLNGDSGQRPKPEGSIEESQQEQSVAAAEMASERRPGTGRATPNGRVETEESNAEKVCNNCGTPAEWLITLCCGHELCVSCFRSPRSEGNCSVCSKPLEARGFLPPKHSLSHVLEKQSHLPCFPSYGTITVVFTLKAENVEEVNCPEAVFRTFIPNTADGRCLFKMFNEASRKGVIFQILPVGDNKGVIYPVKGINFRQEPEDITKEYLLELKTTLQRLLKQPE